MGNQFDKEKDRAEKERLRPYLIPYLESKGVSFKRRGEKLVALCPFHQEKTPSFNVSNGDLYYCFGCGVGGDIFTAIEELERIPEFNKRVDFARDFAGGKRTTSAPIRKAEPIKPEKPLFDYSDFYRIARASIRETDYWIKRGLSEDAVKAFGLGYCKKWTFPGRPGWPCKDVLIIPNSKYSFTARLAVIGEKAFWNVGAKNELFNAGALRSKERVYIAESALDAVSLYDAGLRQAVGLNGAENRGKLIAELKRITPNSRPRSMVIALDNDKNKAGQKAAAAIKMELDALNIPNRIIDSWGDGIKDVNQLLQAGRS